MFGFSFPLYYQLDSRDCGPACLRMVAAHYGRRVSLEYLRELLALSRQGVTLNDLGRGAEQLGFQTLPAEVTLATLQQRVPLPCIAYLDQAHFVVVYAARHGRLYVADPQRGRLRYSATAFQERWQLPGPAGQGIVLLLEPTPQLTEARQEASADPEIGFSYLLGYVRPYRRLVAQLLLGLVVGSLLALVFPFLTQSIIDVGIRTRSVQFIYLVCLAQLLLFLGRTAIELLRARILLLIGSRVSITLLSDYLVKLMKLPMAFFEARNVGDNMQRIVDHHRIELFLTTTLVDTAFSVFSLVVFGAVLLLYSGPIFGVFLVCTTLGVGWALLFLGRRQRLDHRRFAQHGQNQQTLVELIESMPEIKLTGSEQEKRWQWEELQANTYRLNLQTLALDQIIQGGILFFNELKNILITLLAGLQVLDGRLTLGMMLAISFITGQLNNPVVQLLQFLKTAQDARLSLARFEEVYRKPNEDRDDTGQLPLVLPAGQAIRLQNVSFRYGGPDAPLVLQDVSLTIPAGKVTAIVGLSGSGKTTLLKLLLKFYAPSAGAIRVGDTPLAGIGAQQWRQHFGVVMQEGHIFADTIARNIAVGQGPVDEERLRQAGRIANIEEFVAELPLGYHTPVGGTGAGLSQGQKQRLLIARAAYRNPDFIIFDEATNALDATNERTIMDNLTAFFAGKTVVIVAHRLSTVQHADQIVLLEQSRIREIGTHAELLANRGAYYNLVRNQLALGA